MSLLPDPAEDLTAVLLWGFLGGVVLAALSVIPPFLVWMRYPFGNASKEQRNARKRAKRAAKTARDQFLKENPGDDRGAENAAKEVRKQEAEAIASQAGEQARSEAEKQGLEGTAVEHAVEAARRRAEINILKKTHTTDAMRDAPKALGWQLKGFSSDWSFKDNWVSSISLAAAVFTGVFTGTDALKGVVGDAPTTTLSAIAIAAALSAGLVGSGPIFLTIFKRRWLDDMGAAKYNTVGGVLAASFVVMVGVIGLVLTIALAVRTVGVLLTAGAAVALLTVYSWKSIPQILADGVGGQPGRTSSTPLL